MTLRIKMHRSMWSKQNLFSQRMFTRKFDDVPLTTRSEFFFELKIWIPEELIRLILCRLSYDFDRDFDISSLQLHGSTAFLLIQHWVLVVDARSLLLYLDCGMEWVRPSNSSEFTHLAFPLVLLICDSIQHIISGDVDVHHWKLVTRVGMAWVILKLRNHTKEKLD